MRGDGPVTRCHRQLRTSFGLPFFCVVDGATDAGTYGFLGNGAHVVDDSGNGGEWLQRCKRISGGWPYVVIELHANEGGSERFRQCTYVDKPGENAVVNHTRDYFG